MPVETIQDWIKDPYWYMRLAAMKACIGREDVPLEIILIGLRDQKLDVRLTAAEACRGRNIPISTIQDWIKDPYWYMRLAAMKACIGREDVSPDIILIGLRDQGIEVCSTAAEACRGRNIPISTIQDWIKDPYWLIRQTAMAACCGRADVTLDIILIGLRDSDCYVSQMATEACRGCKIPISTIQDWIKDPDWYMRLAAMKACIGREDVPLEIIQAGLEDSNDMVHNAAMEAYLERGIALPVSRDFEPIGYVYKKCLCGVIVVATIPPDAHVRGRPGDKCRASKARIEKIIGDFYGEEVGISTHDNTALYRKGDIVEIKDFDLRHKKYSAGFHFFNSKEAAELYRV